MGSRIAGVLIQVNSHPEVHVLVIQPASPKRSVRLR